MRGQRGGVFPSPQPHQRIFGGLAISDTDPLQPVERLIERGGARRRLTMWPPKRGKNPVSTCLSSSVTSVAGERCAAGRADSGAPGSRPSSAGARTACPARAGTSEARARLIRGEDVEVRAHDFPLGGPHHLRERAARGHPRRAPPAATSAAGGAGRGRASTDLVAGAAIVRLRRAVGTAPSLGVVGEQGVDVVRREPLAAAEERELDEEAAADHLAADAARRARTAPPRCRRSRAGRRARARASPARPRRCGAQGGPAPYSSTYSALTVS